MKRIRVIVLFCLCFISDALPQSNFQLIEVLKQEQIPSQQGAALYGDYLFHFNINSECLIYNIKEKSFVTKIKGVYDKKGHCDTVCFGKKRYKWYDRFPLLYVSGSTTRMNDNCGKIWVYRVSHKKNVWSLTLVQIIETPNVRDVWAYPDAVFDDRGRMWMMGWDHRISFKNEAQRAKVVFNLFDCPRPKDGILKNGISYYSMKSDALIESFEIDNVHKVQQGLCYHNSLIYVPYGSTVSGYQGIDIVDISSRKVIANYNLMGTIVKEPEAVFIYKHDVYIADQGTTIKMLKTNR